MSDSNAPSGSSVGTEPVGTGGYTVRQGDCMESIAADHGHSSEFLWDHPDNRELKDERRDPNVLLPGDRVAIPELRRREEDAATEAKHTFRRKGVPSTLHLVVKRNGKPRAGERYRVLLDGQWVEGSTDGEGAIRVAISPTAASAHLVIGEKPEDQQTFELLLGGLDPVTATSGVQKRLRNLGYPCAESGELDRKTSQALSRFQKNHDLEVNGSPDQATRDKLEELRGC